MARITTPDRQTKPPVARHRGQARDLRPGMHFNFNGEDTFIRTINELCATWREPHVHVVTPEGTRCFAFRMFV